MVGESLFPDIVLLNRDKGIIRVLFRDSKVMSTFGDT